MPAPLAGAMQFGATATAAADPPNCTAADLAGIISGVSAATSAYLFTHPDVNNFFTSLKGQRKTRSVRRCRRSWKQIHKRRPTCKTSGNRR
jgi:hemophore-related protein